jgi:hypothetical protein
MMNDARYFGGEGQQSAKETSVSLKASLLIALSQSHPKVENN